MSMMQNSPTLGNGQTINDQSYLYKHLNGVFAVLIPSLTAVVQLGVHGTTKSPSETHQANFYTFLSATFIYFFAFAAEVKCTIHHTRSSLDRTNHSHFFGVVAFISGSLSSVSIVSIVVPRLFGYIIFISWALVSAFIAYRRATLIKETYVWLLQNIKDTWLYKKTCNKVSSLGISQLLEVSKKTYDCVLQRIKNTCSWLKNLKSLWGSDQQILPVTDSRFGG